MNLRKRIKVFLSLCLTVIIISVSMLPAFAAVTYPNGITKEQTYNSIGKADTLIYNFFNEIQHTTLKETVLPELYKDDILSSILTGLYQAIEAEAGEALTSLGIDISVSKVASYLTAYGDVSDRLSAFSSWTEANLTGAQWGVTDKDGFANALSHMFTPFNDLLYALLCSGSFSLNLIVGIKGSNGYETAIIPTLRSLGCEYITEPSTFYAEAKDDKGRIMYNIVSDVLTMAEGALDAPCDRLTDILPSIAYYFTSGGFENAVSILIEPLKLQIFNISTVIAVESIARVISDAESFTQGFSINVNDILANTGMNLAPVDLELLASCGTVSDGVVTADKADTFIVLLRWVFDTLKLNKDMVKTLLPEMGKEVQSIFTTVFSKDTDELITFMISLLTQTSGQVNDFQWTFSEYVAGSGMYTANLGAEKFQRVADNADEVLDMLVAEMGEEKSLGRILKKELYSSETLTMLIPAIYGLLESEEATMVVSMLGADVSPKAVSEHLSKGGHRKAANNIAALSSWSSVGTDAIDWGIREGNRKQFASVLVSALSPFEEALNMLLAEGSIQVLGAVDVYGSNGYNTAIIPVYEALGCEASTIKTYEEYKALSASGKGVEALLEPLLDLLDRIIDRPVYTALSILPNLLYFAETNLMVCVENLLYPFNSIIRTLGLEEAFNFDSYRNLDVKKLIGELIASVDIGIALPAIDITHISSLGTQTQMVSKRTVNGQPVTVPYIQADMAGLSAAFMRIISGVVKSPANEGLINSLIDNSGELLGTADSEGTNELVTGFATGLITDIRNMTEDEFVEWLYKLLFRERVTVPETDKNEDYMPTIIYKSSGRSTFTAVIIFAVIIFAGAYIILRKKKKAAEAMNQSQWLYSQEYSQEKQGV